MRNFPVRCSSLRWKIASEWRFCMILVHSGLLCAEVVFVEPCPLSLEPSGQTSLKTAFLPDILGNAREKAPKTQYICSSWGKSTKSRILQIMVGLDWRQLLHYLCFLEEGSLLGQDCVNYHGSELSKLVEPLGTYCSCFERDSRDPPDFGKQRRIRPFSRDSKEFRDSRDSSSEKTPSIMTPSVTVLAASEVMAISVMTATPFKLSPPFPTSWLIWTSKMLREVGGNWLNLLHGRGEAGVYKVQAYPRLWGRRKRTSPKVFLQHPQKINPKQGIRRSHFFWGISLKLLVSLCGIHAYLSTSVLPLCGNRSGHRSENRVLRIPDLFTFLRHAMQATLSVRPKCSHRCVSLKQFPLKPVPILKHATTEQSSQKEKNVENPFKASAYQVLFLNWNSDAVILGTALRIFWGVFNLKSGLKKWKV